MWSEPQYVVTATKSGENGLLVFGPLGSEADAQLFFEKLQDAQGWQPDEIQVLNPLESIDNNTAQR